ncbi:hypothetical protein EV363DRAFT_1589631 [Boletus edulis]|nr:hypothetical protein EV363DRAFT_1589631 [Boletus edulis]
MASNGPSVPSDLSKLTVPQLKALCKERRITGYSKLSKAALLQKLAEVTAPTKTTTPSNVQASQRATAVPSADEVRNPANTTACIGSSNVCPAANATNATHQPVQPTSTGNTDPTETRSTAKDPLPSELPKSSQNHTATSTTSTRTQKTSGTKRPAHIDTSGDTKRIRTSLNPATTVGHEPPAPRTSTLQQKLPVDSSVFKVPELPTQRKRSLHGSASTLAKRPPGTGKDSASHQITGGPGRFKPLAVARPKSVEPDQANKEPSRNSAVSVAPRAVDSAVVSDFHATPLPVLSPISLPPRASERKWVYRWAIVLSAISPEDRQTCSLVSRTFRYAVYLSAFHILSKGYAGHRLDAILEQHPRNMTNLWPYLQFRMAEVFERRDTFKRSFLGRYTDLIGYDPLSSHLWASPDDEKQVDVAIRFVLTRMWFAVSIGAYGHDAFAWSRCIIRDVREVVQGEIWRVVALDNGTGASCSFYVLEATCEVIGRPPSSQGEDTLEFCLRADWTTWISQQSRTPLDTGPRSLLECVKWSNTEDYHRGISKAWLHRVQGQDGDNIAERIVAERYILASVVANSISGPWMSTSAMAQEFAGLPDRDAHGSRTAGRSTNTVNMYLPAHHHVESVHFTTYKGEALHGAVAVVQTPGREYYVLRDNGMQVGCEEEGIPEVWQRILGCDALGRAC